MGLRYYVGQPVWVVEVPPDGADEAAWRRAFNRTVSRSVTRVTPRITTSDGATWNDDGTKPNGPGGCFRLVTAQDMAALAAYDLGELVAKYRPAGCGHG